MPTAVRIGFSQHPDPSQALLQACVQIKNELPSVDLAIVFASPEYITSETQSIITRTLRPKQLTGTTAAGLLSAQGPAGRGIMVIGFHSDDLSLGVAATSIEAPDLRQAGFELARKAAEGLNVSRRDVFTNTYRKDLFLFLGRGMEKNSLAFIRGIKEVFGLAFPVVGIAASGDAKKTVQLFQDSLLHNCAVGLLLGGIGHPALGCTHGFKPLGKPRKATEISGQRLLTIDQRPALEIYEHFLGLKGELLKKNLLGSFGALYPLGFYVEGSRQYLLRNIIDIGDDGSIVLHEGIPQGAEVHLMISNAASCQSSAVHAAELVKAGLAGKSASVVLIFESLSRYNIPGRNVSAEIQAVRRVLGDAPVAGICTAGEIGPFDSMDTQNSYLHNGTVLMIGIA